MQASDTVSQNKLVKRNFNFGFSNDALCKLNELVCTTVFDFSFCLHLLTAYFFARTRRRRMNSVFGGVKEEGEKECEEGQHPAGLSQRGGGVASVPVAATVLDEDVEGARSLEAGLRAFLVLAAQPAAPAHESVVITNCKKKERKR